MKEPPRGQKEVGVPSNENPPSTWTYQMEVSPTGQPAPVDVTQLNDPLALLRESILIQRQTFQLQQQVFELQRQQLELIKETTQVAREQRARQVSELERWQASHERILEPCKESLAKLEQVHASLLSELADYVDEHHEDMLDGEYVLTDFVDRFGPRLAHLNTILAVLRPLAAAIKKTE
jgi:hypothetical protein